jgi:small subunit ribosomal protein S2
MNTDTSGALGVDRLFDAGAHFAQVKSRRHPSMKPFVIGQKSKVEIFDLVKTDAQLAKAKAALTALGRDGKTVLFVGGKREASDIVKAAATKAQSPFVAGRWLGGTISNFVEIKKRIDRLADLTAKRDSGELAKQHTKLELVFIGREIDRLKLRLDGITSITKKPDAMVVVDTRHEAHAVKEARQAGIPIIALMSSDCDLKEAAYPIAMNDSSREAVRLVLDELAAALIAGRQA